MDIILQKVKQYLLNRKDIEFAYLFGSYATGRQHSHSDIDIAVMFTEGLKDKDYDRFMCRLEIENDLEALLKKKVNILDLNTADLPFIHQILMEGKILFEKNVENRVQFEVNFRKKYFDFRPVLDLYFKEVLKRI